MIVFINISVSSSEKTVVFVGEKLSGKSSLIAKFLDEPVKDDMKETTALDYRYGVRVKDDKKQKVNIYELGK
jgi:GTPase SAR1 family protein